MNSEKIAKLHMYLTVRIFLRSNPAILAKLPNAEEYLGELDAAILELQNNIAQQEAGVAELRSEEDKLYKRLLATIIENQGKLKAFAQHENDMLMLDFCKKSKTVLEAMSEGDLVRYAKTMLGYLTANAEKLVKYQIKAEDTAALQKVTNDYDAIGPELTKAKSDLDQTKLSVGSGYQKTDAIMAKLDIEMEIVKVSDSDFYNQYKSLRHINRNINSCMLVGHIFEAETGKELPNATVSFKLNDSNDEPIVKLSAEKGGFQIKSIAAGIYTVTITKIGYIAQTTQLIITGDEKVVFDVHLVKVTTQG